MTLFKHGANQRLHRLLDPDPGVLRGIFQLTLALGGLLVQGGRPLFQRLALGLDLILGQGRALGLEGLYIFLQR